MTFELCAHPLQSKARIRSAMLVFDSLVKSFSLTCMDAADQRAMIFPAGEVAVVNMVDVPPTQALVHAPNASCTCPSLCLPPSNPRAAGKTPVWLTNPGWGDTWSVAEIQREQNRKLVWCALKAYTTFMAKEAETDEGYMSFFVADPFNVCLNHLHPHVSVG